MQLAMVYVTCPDLDSARALARALLDRRLVACANFTRIESVYRYEGHVRDEPEVLVLLKTRKEIAQRVVDAVGELHPYDVPCAVAYDAARRLVRTRIGWATRRHGEGPARAPAPGATTGARGTTRACARANGRATSETILRKSRLAEAVGLVT